MATPTLTWVGSDPGRAGRRRSGKGESTRADASGAASPPLLVVGVGAFAGGFEACERLFQGAPTNAALAFVVVLHLAPGELSHVAEILQRVTAVTVTQVASDLRVERDHVYVIAPGTSLGIRDGALAAGAPDERGGRQRRGAHAGFRARPQAPRVCAAGPRRRADPRPGATRIRTPRPG